MVPRGPNPTHPAPILGEVELHIVAQGILIPSYIRKSAARPPLCLMQCVEARKRGALGKMRLMGCPPGR